ncbi:MAG: hypothetical protein ABEH56_06980 [Salinirussus sp.]
MRHKAVCGLTVDLPDGTAGAGRRHGRETGLPARPVTIRVEPDAGATLRFDDAYEQTIEVGPRETEPAAVADFLRRHSEVDVPARDGIAGILFSRRRRYTQRWIPVGADLYLLGGAEPVEPDGTTTSGLVLRRDVSSDEFVISDRSEAELVESARWTAPAEIVGGTGLSAAGLYLLLTGLGVA